MTRWDPRIGMCALLVALCASLAAGEARAAAGDEVAAEVAEIGNTATVGIYCEVTRFEQYYGTGAIVSPDGYILTSTTVVPAGSTNIRIYFTDHTRQEARIVEINEDVESTLLKVEGTDHAFLPIAKELPRVGERAYTFGNAHNMIRLGEQASFSSGIISGVYHVKSADGQSSYEGLALESDAAINPGQDGGPLLDSHGRLVGIISLSYSDSRWQGMAVPVTRLRERLAALQDGRVRLSTRSSVAPAHGDTAAGSQFAAQARQFASYLVSLRVERAHPPERMPRYHWADYRKSIDGWDALSFRDKALRQNDFFMADQILGANQQLRRPPDPVTGIVISPDGFILTSTFNLNADRTFVHKKEGLQPIEYTGSARALVETKPNEYRTAKNALKSVTAILANGTEFPAKVVARHVPMGVALLKIDARRLRHLKLEWLRADPALGEAVGVQGVMGAGTFTLNTGMVSATSRDRGMKFQFDALLNYGNSGGPVFNRTGRLLGIATSPMNPAPVMGRILPQAELQRWRIAPNSGIGFAARADKIADALADLKAGTSVEKIGGAFLGVGPDPRFAFANRTVVGRVSPKSAASEAGLKKGDVLLKINGRPIGAWRDLVTEIEGRAPGDTIELTLRRGEEVLDLTVTLGERP